MASNAFRKGSASSVLVTEKTWQDVINKPGNFDEIASRIIDMMLGAEEGSKKVDETYLGGLLLASNTFGEVKQAINAALLDPLLKDYSSPARANSNDGPVIYPDFFWDEIQTESNWQRIRDALLRAAELRSRIDEQKPLTSSDKLQDVKNTFNETILKPLLDIHEDD